jgi:hypothetical protein
MHGHDLLPVFLLFFWSKEYAKVRADQTMLPLAGHGNGACARALDNERLLRLRAVQPT